MAATIGKVKRGRPATKKTATKKIRGLANTLKVGERTYTKTTCSRLKSDAAKKVKKLRADGMVARMKQDPTTKTYCVFSAKSKRKVATKK